MPNITIVFTVGAQKKPINLKVEIVAFLTLSDSYPIWEKEYEITDENKNDQFDVSANVPEVQDNLYKINFYEVNQYGKFLLNALVIDATHQIKQQAAQ